MGSIVKEYRLWILTPIQVCLANIIKFDYSDNVIKPLIYTIDF